MSLDTLMRRIIPYGLWVPVLTGTRQVTIGGAIASDIHGKNHHSAGSFGNHVVSMDLMTADGTVRTLTPEGRPGRCSGPPSAEWGSPASCCAPRSSSSTPRAPTFSSTPTAPPTSRRPWSCSATAPTPGVFSAGTQWWICGVDPGCAKPGVDAPAVVRTISAITTRLLDAYAQGLAGGQHPAVDNL